LAYFALCTLFADVLKHVNVYVKCREDFDLPAIFVEYYYIE